jgi:hypothetical protein
MRSAPSLFFAKIEITALFRFQAQGRIVCAANGSPKRAESEPKADRQRPESDERNERLQAFVLVSATATHYLPIKQAISHLKHKLLRLSY